MTETVSKVADSDKDHLVKDSSMLFVHCSLAMTSPFSSFPLFISLLFNVLYISITCVSRNLCMFKTMRFLFAFCAKFESS